MIAIPNRSKPKHCYECPIAKSYLDCLMEKKYVCPIGHTDDCQLIDIVTCGECKYYEESEYIEGDMVCKYHMGHTYYTEDDRFCSYGERRNENDRQEEWLDFREEQEFNDRWGKE